MRVRLGVLLAVVGGTLSIGAVEASAASRDVLGICDQRGHACMDVPVPLDWTGAVPGTVKIQIDRQRARRAVRPPLLAIGGTPGLTSVLAGLADSIGTEGRSRDVVIMDLRGTGGSGPLRCPALQRDGLRGTATAAAACARRLGPRRGFYTARDSAQDVEAVRKAIGAERIAIFGQAHGARVAFEFARSHPNRVDRLVLDSPLASSGVDALQRPSLTAVPGVVRSRCGQGACRRASRSPIADVVTLARRVERRSLRGTAVDGTGRRHSVAIRPADLLTMIGTASSSSIFAAFDQRVLPGLFRNARRGDLAPLLRARHSLDDFDGVWALPGMQPIFSVAAYAASVCEESQMPWPRAAPLDARPGLAQTVVSDLPTSAFAPFGPRSALGSDVIELCKRWPVASPPADPIMSLAALPALVLAPEDDLYTPVAGAEEIARLIPGSRLMRLPGVGSTVYSPSGRCVSQVIARFLAGGQPDDCPRPRRQARALPAPPVSLSEVAPAKGAGGRSGRTIAAARMTLRDAANRLPVALVAQSYELLSRKPKIGWRRAARRPIRVGGLRGGSMALRLVGGRAVVRAASYVPGVRVDGTIEHFADGKWSKRHGTIHVSGPSASHGTLTVHGSILRGWLAGRYVKARLNGPAFNSVSFGAAKAPGPAAVLATVRRAIR